MPKNYDVGKSPSDFVPRGRRPRRGQRMKELGFPKDDHLFGLIPGYKGEHEREREHDKSIRRIQRERNAAFIKGTGGRKSE